MSSNDVIYHQIDFFPTTLLCKTYFLYQASGWGRLKTTSWMQLLWGFDARRKEPGIANIFSKDRTFPHVSFAFLKKGKTVHKSFNHQHSMSACPFRPWSSSWLRDFPCVTPKVGWNISFCCKFWIPLRQEKIPYRKGNKSFCIKGLNSLFYDRIKQFFCFSS